MSSYFCSTPPGITESDLSSSCLRFEAWFKGENGMAASIPSCNLGFVELTQLREKFGADIPIERIVRETGLLKIDPVIDVPMPLVAEATVFGHQHRVEVSVPHGHLNRFVQMVPDSAKLKGEDQPTIFFLRLKLDGAPVLEAWQKAGYPTRWGLDDAPDNAAPKAPKMADIMCPYCSGIFSAGDEGFDVDVLHGSALAGGTTFHLCPVCDNEFKVKARARLSFESYMMEEDEE